MGRLGRDCEQRREGLVEGRADPPRDWAEARHRPPRQAGTNGRTRLEDIDRAAQKGQEWRSHERRMTEPHGLGTDPKPNSRGPSRPARRRAVGCGFGSSVTRAAGRCRTSVVWFRPDRNRSTQPRRDVGGSPQPMRGQPERLPRLGGQAGAGPFGGAGTGWPGRRRVRMRQPEAVASWARRRLFGWNVRLLREVRYGLVDGCRQWLIRPRDGRQGWVWKARKCRPARKPAGGRGSRGHATTSATRGSSTRIREGEGVGFKHADRATQTTLRTVQDGPRQRAGGAATAEFGKIRSKTGYAPARASFASTVRPFPTRAAPEVSTGCRHVGVVAGEVPC